MLQTIDEIKKADMTPGTIINGVDNANLLSVDSTTPIPTDVDQVKPEDNRGEEEKLAEVLKVEVKPGEKKEEKDVKATGELKEKPAENIEEEKKDEKEEVFTDSVEKRIGKLTKKWRTTERERDYERTKRVEAEQELAKLKAMIPAEDKPRRDDFEDDEAFLEALADWKVESKLRSHGEVVSKRVSEDTEKHAINEVAQEIEEIADRGSDKYQDYSDVVYDKDLVLNQNMLEAIIVSDVAEDILYYLGKNPDVSAAIGEMSPLKASKEIWKIEMELAKGKTEKKEESKPAPVKQVTKAPEPIVPPRQTGATEKDPSQMSPKEYRAWRERNK
jgi:hypothetical protein